MPPLSSRTLAALRAGVGRTRGGVPPVRRDLAVTADAARVWAALTDPEVIARWLTCQDVTFEARVGGSYRLFDGDATGTITRCEPPRRLEFTWRMAGWPPDAPPSNVHWRLTPLSGGRRTRMELDHSGFPDRATRDAHDAGWDESFLDKLLPWLERR